MGRAFGGTELCVTEIGGESASVAYLSSAFHARFHISMLPCFHAYSTPVTFM